jgi:hypothetical protein
MLRRGGLRLGLDDGARCRSKIVAHERSRAPAARGRQRVRPPRRAAVRENDACRERDPHRTQKRGPCCAKPLRRFTVMLDTGHNVMLAQATKGLRRAHERRYPLSLSLSLSLPPSFLVAQKAGTQQSGT